MPLTIVENSTQISGTSAINTDRRDQHGREVVGQLAAGTDALEGGRLDRAVQRRRHFAPFLATAARASEFTTKVSTNNTRPAAM